MRYMKFDRDNIFIPDGWERTFEFVDKPASIGFYAQPAIGISLRTTKNSYIELKGNILLATKVKGTKERNGDIAISVRDKKVNTPCFVSFGFTHTFGKRGKKLR